MNPEPLLSVRGLAKFFPGKSQGWRRTPGAPINAVDGVSFDLQPGKTLGLVGESGCGKSTTARCILRALDPTAGEIIFRDGQRPPVDLATLSSDALKPMRTRMQMVFQDPFASLNPRMTVARLVGEPLQIHGLGGASERQDRVVNVLKKVGIDPINAGRYPHEFSGGQRQRICIARALVVNPAFVIFDESVSALDVSVQAQVLNLIADLRADLGLTSLFVGHDLSVVRFLCDEIAVMYAGRIVEHASTAELFANPKHPYTRALLAAVPNPDPRVRLAAPVMGEVADPAHLPTGCAFHPRCGQCLAQCSTSIPHLLPVGKTRVACHAVES